MAFKLVPPSVVSGPRNPAGAWLRQKLHGWAGVMLVLTGFTMGVLLSFGTFGWLPFWREISLAVGFGCFLLLLLLNFVPMKWSLDNLEKGMAGEQRMGQGIEYALTAEHCAVAHGVTSIDGLYGDVDHLVATPLGLLVVETKYRRVPESQFNRVLSRLSVNVKAVRRWAPKDTLVRGYLVLVEDDGFHKDSYGAECETILVHSGKAFRQKLLKESREPLARHNGLSHKVWKLASDD